MPTPARTGNSVSLPNVQREGLTDNYQEEAKMLRRILFIVTVPCAAVIAFATPALAAGVSPGTYSATFSSQAPASSHVANGSAQPTCTVNQDLSISCNSYTLGGVGHTNADVLLVANYTAIVDCFNPGTNPNNPIESHQTSVSPRSETTVTSSKNGQLAVPAQSVNFTGEPVGCPNPNWTPVIRPGSQTLVSFSYTLTFAGFSSPYITIAQP